MSNITTAGHAAGPFHFPLDWDEIREKVETTCTQENTAIATLTGVTLLMYGALAYWLYQALQNYTIIGY